MENSVVEDHLDEARALFDTPTDQPETGLDVQSAELVQLRKACRLLEAAQHLRAENGYYTVVIEASFAAIERTLQFYLLDNGFLRPEEYIDHQTVYERCQEAGVYSEAIGDKLIDLWRNNRARTYYREGVGSQDRADSMVALAESIHSHVLHLARREFDCICD